MMGRITLGWENRELTVLLSIAFNTLVTNGLAHPYHLGEPTFIYRDIKSIFSYLFHFSMKIF